ncbi:hypothetical protein [Holdemania massiliensis]
MIIAVILIGLLIAYITMADNGFAAQLTSGISKTVGNLLDLGQHYTPSIS